jgi:hypothetical protein
VIDLDGQEKQVGLLHIYCLHLFLCGLVTGQPSFRSVRSPPTKSFIICTQHQILFG